MNEDQISNILKKDIYTKKYFVGVFSRTCITITGRLPSIYVVNLDNYGSPGFHWIAVYVDCEYINIFDSFGGNYLNDPSFASFINYCKNKNQKVVTSPIAIQSLFSSTCGLYCILFAMIMARKKTYSSFISIFKNNKPEINDEAISVYFKKYYNVTLQN